MVPSLRLLRYLLLGAPLWLLAVLAPGGWLAAAVFFLFLIWACLRDLSTCPPRSSFLAQRQLPQRFSLEEKHTVELTLSNNSDRSVVVSVRDELPGRAEAGGDPGGAARVSRRRRAGGVTADGLATS